MKPWASRGGNPAAGRTRCRECRRSEHVFGLGCRPDYVCAKEERCLVTLDLDFGNPFLFKPSLYRGIALLRLPSKIRPDDIQDAIDTLVGALEKDVIDKKLWIIQRGKIRVYQEEA